jgi:uncharacterized protein involved in exopolysaccharide biosynthesis
MIQPVEENNEYISISISPLLAVLKREYKVILLVTLVSSIIGFVNILITPKEYISTSKIMPEVAYKASNGIAGINQLLRKYNGNIDLYNTEITSPELYAEILNTSEFYNYIATKEVTTSTNKKMSFQSYYDFNFEKNKSFFQKEESDFKSNSKIKSHSIIQDIQKRIVITVKKNNLIFVTAKMQDPVVAADVANFTVTYLIDYITKYRTEKTYKELLFIEGLKEDVSKDSTKSDALKEEIQNSLSTSIIQMKIKIQEDTPTIQVLEKAQIPVVNSEPSVPKVLLGFTFLGFLIGVVIAFLRKHNYKMIFNSNQ